MKAKLQQICWLTSAEVDTKPWAISVDKRGSRDEFLPCSRDMRDFSSKSGRCHPNVKINTVIK